MKNRKLLLIILVLCAMILTACSSADYKNANALMESGDFVEAAKAFAALGSYKDSASKQAECYEALDRIKYEEAVILLEDGRPEEALALFNELGDYADSCDRVLKCSEMILHERYEQAVRLLENKDYAAAAEAFAALGEYNDCEEQAVLARKMIDVQEIASGLSSAVAGDVVTFGHYEQDADESDGREGIEWIVLSNEGGRVMLLSRFGLDTELYHPETVDVTWESSHMRQWLNSSFINAAFTELEQVLIETVTVSTPDNPEYPTVGGSDTEDKVFLLSMQEASIFFASDEARQCVPTDYAVSAGAYVYADTGTSLWWLRTPGYQQANVCFVGFRGYDTDFHGYRVSHGDQRGNAKGVVRPTIVVNTDF